ncbi:hypothetical protein [Azonexus sp. IMCC34839]|uniref:hypothetical protein n=1 Tax=Azonexus sp. IMCC34839 TaxID=3133695 RepID=UPI00399BCFAD
MTRGKEKRSGEDRRISEDGPPSGWRERRKTVERRLPRVVEISLTEWAREVVSVRTIKEGHET